MSRRKELYSDADIRRMLRRKRRKLADVGVYCLRVLVQEQAYMKPRRVEISLGTYSLTEATVAARSVINFIHAWGFRLTHKQERQADFFAILPPRKGLEKLDEKS